MGLIEQVTGRVSHISRQFSGRLRQVGSSFVQARRETEIGVLVTLLHSPDLYNPSMDHVRITQLESVHGISLTPPTLQGQRTESDYATIRDKGTQILLSTIPDAERRRIMHIAALEQALDAWRVQSDKENPRGDLAYIANANRILDEINRLRQSPDQT